MLIKYKSHSPKVV